ncbi:MAG TPA: rhodanese-like domain-containing protein [Campylobacterales bacterium]|nr:rhodanese-like domain-containing protein [Campylobacterales bacterium]
MKKFTDILFWIILLAMGVYILYQKGYILKNYEDITVLNAYNQMLTDTNITLLDVRTKEEIKSDGAIKNHILVPVQILERNLDKLEKYKSTKIFVYCQSGNRSVTASRILSNAGFKSYNVKGGIIEWKKQKLPLK